MKALREMTDEEFHEYKWSLLCTKEVYEAADAAGKINEMEKEEERRMANIKSSINYLRRKFQLSGGKHTKSEIAEILALQGNRCIYCNVLFTEKELPTRDHIKPIAMRGSDWALNIVMACRSCNASRSKTHFLAYCKSLNRKQRQRILKYLNRRIETAGLLIVLDRERRLLFSNLRSLRTRLIIDC